MNTMRAACLAVLAILCISCGANEAARKVGNTTGEEAGLCKANMQTIASAVQNGRATKRSNDYSPYFGSVDSSHEPDLLGPPVCPSGGNYSVEAGPTGSDSFQVRCSVHGVGP